jgi:hypothetical protein
MKNILVEEILEIMRARSRAYLIEYENYCFKTKDEQITLQNLLTLNLTKHELLSCSKCLDDIILEIEKQINLYSCISS